jgi:hypothetical protein
MSEKPEPPRFSNATLAIAAMAIGIVLVVVLMASALFHAGPG